MQCSVAQFSSVADYLYEIVFRWGSLYDFAREMIRFNDSVAGGTIAGAWVAVAMKRLADAWGIDSRSHTCDVHDLAVKVV
jgi:hypothetical protein